MNKANLRAVTFLLLTIFLFSKCTKIDFTGVGSGLIPGADNVHTFDTTLSIIGNNIDAVGECDSIGPNDLLALGIISNDPLFGNARAEMYFEVKPPTFPVALPEHDTLSMVVDSVVLVLKYTHSFGDTNVVQKVTVHELTDGLQLDSIYKTCSPLPYSTEVLGEATFTPVSLKDSIHGFNEDDAYQLRIRMPASIGEDFIANVAKFESDSAFREYYKGFALVPDESTGGNALNYFNMRTAVSRLAIYVRSQRDTIADTSSLVLTINNYANQANYINKQRETSEITQHLTNAPQGDSLLFIQSFPSGSYAELKIPGLNNFPNRVINKAEIIIDQVFDPASIKFEVPSLLYLDIPDTAGIYIPIPCDFDVSGIQAGVSTIGGYPQSTTDENGNAIVRYRFNISRYIQSIVTRKEENATMRLRAPFYVENYQSYVDRCNQLVTLFSVPVNSAGDGSVKLNGTNNSTGKIRLNIVYSNL